MSARFTKADRLLKPADFSYVFSSADVKAGSGEFFLLARKTRQQAMKPRIGFILSRKKVKRAVDRNRIKRIAREQFRTLSVSDNGYPPIDIVFMANRGADKLDRPTVHRTVRSLLNKLQQRYARSETGKQT